MSAEVAISIEWQDKYNSFNSDKGLMYFEWYRAILEGKFLPPIEASVDPVNACNLSCVWCNNVKTRARNVLMSDNHLLELIDFFKVWPVMAVCIAGGGEPTMHPKLGEAFIKCKKLGLPCALMTNGTFPLGEDMIEAVAKSCRWIGVSVDCATSATYKDLKGHDKLSIVTTNICKLVKYGSREVMYKFLLHPKNQNEVYAAIKLAKEIGCHGIHIRPVSFRNYQESEDEYNVTSINDQVERGRRDFETERFKVFYIRHKFDDKMHRKFGFTKCRATPIMPIFHANNDISICIDRKNDPLTVIGKHTPIDNILKVWGSDEHKRVIESVKLDECPKCTFAPYNVQIEKAVINNEVDWNFT